jgi:hypothetical protein
VHPWKIEQKIAAEVSRRDRTTGAPRTVLVCSRNLASEVFEPHDGLWHEERWEPTNAQTKALIRAMHSFCGKSNRYALTGGQGRGIFISMRLVTRYPRCGQK